MKAIEWDRYRCEEPLIDIDWRIELWELKR